MVPQEGLDLVEDHRQALQVGIEGGELWIMVSSGLIKHVPIHALRDQEAKRKIML